MLLKVQREKVMQPAALPQVEMPLAKTKVPVLVPAAAELLGAEVEMQQLPQAPRLPLLKADLNK